MKRKAEVKIDPHVDKIDYAAAVKAVFFKQAEDWALHACLRLGADPRFQLTGDVEEALIMCMFCIWALENFDE